MPDRKNKVISFIGWVIVITIPLTILIAATELTLRYLLPDVNILTKIIKPSLDSRGYVLKENTKIIYQGLTEKREPIIWEINQQGLRSDRLEKTNSNNFRILTYGDSETYGWSVDVEDSWQRKMEDIDSNTEVLNFGIPGYNVENVADHMQYSITDYHPDMLIYFFNKNDFYPAFNFHPWLSRSYTYLAVRMGIYRLFKEKRKTWRNSSQGEEFVQSQVMRMVKLSEQNKIPLYILVMHWEYVKPIQNIYDTNKNSIKIINIEELVDRYANIDAHLAKPAHSALAQHLCKIISLQDSKKCTPDSFKHSIQ